MIKRKRITGFVSLVTLMSIVYVFACWKSQYFSNLFLLPVSFMLFILLFNRRTLLKSKSVFSFCFVAFAFLRYVVLPVVMTMSGYDSGRSSIHPTQKTTEQAIYMMSFELFVCSIAMFFVSKKCRQHLPFEPKKWNERNDVYKAFIIVSIVLLAIVPSAFKNLNFFSADDNFERAFNSNGIFYAAVLYFALTAKSLLFCLGSLYFSKKYNKTKKIRFLFANILLCMLNVGIYYGASRLSIITTAVASLCFLYLLYDNKRAILYSSLAIGGLLIIVLVSLTMARSISYGNTISSLADTISIYTGGPYNVAIAIETPSYYPAASSFETFLYDFTRPIIGIGYLVNDANKHYSVYYFNYRMTFGNYFTQILPMVGQSYFYFGFLFSPLFSLMWFLIGSKMESIGSKTKRPELYYFLLFNALRISTFMGQSSINQINSLSMNMLLFIILYFINKRVVVVGSKRHLAAKKTF